tara:strand:- start:22481 stop:23695 length:1215 start_codon:yes stop_codon:yes gene_type:complete
MSLTVIGIGDDGMDGLSARARARLADAALIVGSPRHLSMLPTHDSRERIAWSKDLSADIEALAPRTQSEHVVVLASGDPLMYGIGSRLLSHFGAENVLVLPGSSAFSLAAARMGWPLSDPMLSCVSIHGLSLQNLALHIQPNVKLLILSRDKESPTQIAKMLCTMDYSDSPMSILECMNGDREKRTDAVAKDDIGDDFQNLNTVAVQCVANADLQPLSRSPGLPDDAFEHDGTITKREVRAITLAALAPLPGDVLWDIGAGNGTIAIEWLRVEPRAHALAFEKDSVRADRICANAAALGVPALQVVAKHFPPAPNGIEPKPDAIFIGGGLASDDDLIATCLKTLKPGGRVVANAVTLEAQARLMTAHAVHGGELVRIAIARADAVGTLQAMKSSIDVLQWRVTV